MELTNKYVSWSKLDSIKIDILYQYLKNIHAKPDPFLKNKPAFVIVGNTTYESNDYSSWRLTNCKDSTIISESEFLTMCSTLKPKELLADCLKPTTLEDVIGHGPLLETIEDWLNSSKKEFNAILLTGPPGIGKTTIAHLVPKHCGFNVIEFNASDCRSASSIKELFGTCKKTNALRKTCIVMDEIDGMSAGDKGGMSELASIIKSTSIPFICIANERSNPKIKPIVSVSFDLKVHRPNKATIANCLKTKLVKYDLHYSKEELEELCEKNGNDIRSIINNIDFGQSLMKTSNKDISHMLDPFSATSKLMNSKVDINTKASYVYFDSSLVPLMVQEIYISTSEKSKKSLEEIWKASDALSTFDMYDRYIHKKQDYSLYPDAVHCVVQAAVSASGPPPFQMFPAYLGKCSKMNKHKRQVKDLASALKQSSRSLILDSIDYLNMRLFTPLKDAKNIHDVIKDIDTLHISKDHLFETLPDCSFVDHSKSIDGKTKAAFTREYNKFHVKFEISKVEVDSSSDSDDYDDSKSTLSEIVE